MKPNLASLALCSAAASLCVALGSSARAAPQAPPAAYQKPTSAPAGHVVTKPVPQVGQPPEAQQVAYRCIPPPANPRHRFILRYPARYCDR
jgi:hypothetical protein